ncbi:lytic transglycosylase domain-containing protein [Salipiger mucosus]|uniref:Soluble lytic murein transglycosylase n=1 Tax=Salipiger mucosus DSM 16094 TaxID=1123237 RepID=S9Q9F1_9RHOB|nr:lytic transglycosylase domain-containing protein [Salipiger mucosus]EPX78001.1 Soluble lytic murein transglycosylase [Salipiger mucosus DSM 16094]
MRSALLALSLSVSALAVPAVSAPGGWSWLSNEGNETTNGQMRPKAVGQADEDVCAAHIKSAQNRYGIPNDILLGIGLQETGQKADHGKLAPWPWSANAAGRGRWFDNKDDSLEWVRHQLDSGTDSVDVGCMQINLRWHPEAFNSLEDAFDPASNVDYAARLLVRLRKQVGSWELAAGSYHSFTPKYRQRYLGSLRNKFRYIERNATHYDRIAQATSRPDPGRQVDQATVQQNASGPLWNAALSDGGSAREDGDGSLYSSGAISPLFVN